MEAVMLPKEDYIKLSEAVFLLLAYYGHHNVSTIERLHVSPIKLHLVCAIVPDRVLERAPSIVKQAINYVRSLPPNDCRNFFVITFSAKLFALDEFVCYLINFNDHF